MTEKSYQNILLQQMTIPMKLLSNYSTIGLDEKDVIILLQIHRFLLIGNDFPTLPEISKHLTISNEECIEKLRILMQKNLLEIKELKNNNGQWSEAYSLEPLWQRLLAFDYPEENEEGKLFVLFENEFGRPLSPFEIETINVWIDADKMPLSLIKAALRESVLMGKLNFKYIDRILREWKRKGIKTVDQARQEGESFRREQTKKEYEPRKRDTSVYYNWLDGGK